MTSTTMNGARPLMADPLRTVELHHKPTPEMIERAEALRVRGEELMKSGAMPEVVPESDTEVARVAVAPAVKVKWPGELLICIAASPFVVAYAAWAWSVVRWAWRVIGGAPLW